MIRFFFLLAFLIISIPAHAQEEQAQAPEQITNQPYKLGSTKYSPDYCQFTANFPEEPLVTNRCETEGDLSTCYNLISYTKVLELSSTINIEIICNPATKEMYEGFTTEAMEDTVRAMTKDTVIEAFDVDSIEHENFRQAGLIGKGKKGLHDTIYLSQLWVSENSIMSVEAEMSGEQTEEADLMFANILRSIGYTGDTAKEGSDESQEPPVPTEP